MRSWMMSLLMIAVLTVSLGIVGAQETNARVIRLSGYLNVRATASTSAPVLAEVTSLTRLNVSGRTAGNNWYQVTTPQGVTGWVAADYVDLIGVALADIPVVDAPQTASAPTAPTTIPAQASAPASPALASAGSGRVAATLLNMRTTPNTNSAVIAELPDDTIVNLLGRNANSTWLYAQTSDGTTGWLYSRYVTVNGAVSSLPTVNATGAPASNPAPPQQPDTLAQENAVPPAPGGDAPYFLVGAEARNTYQRGAALGNNRNVFSKVGDSITVADSAYNAIGHGLARFGNYGYLRSTASYFSASFTRGSLAAGGGWNASIVHNANFANPRVCNPGESPIACEYRVNRPAVALIMLGTNDVTSLPVDQYMYYMRVTIEYSQQNGVIPVVSTIPQRQGYEGRVALYNDSLLQVASRYGVSVWDYAGAMARLPQGGISGDGIHPSEPPRGASDSATFTDEYLQYGYNQRNLTALQALYILQTQVMN